jgi:hypothetical protein
MSTTPLYAGIRCLLAGKTALIFDFDGTIAETTPLHARACEATLPSGVSLNTAPPADWQSDSLTNKVVP